MTPAVPVSPTAQPLPEDRIDTSWRAAAGAGYTGKDHVKAIFAKTAVHSRRELAAMLKGGSRGAACR